MKSSKLMSVLLSLILLCAFAVSANAAQIDTAAENTLSLTFAPGDIPAPDVQYRLYRVANVTADVKFDYTPKFASYPIAPIGTTAEEWRMLAETLQGIIAADAVPADYTAQTDENGSFTLSGLSTGLYLLTGDIFIYNGMVYTPQPFLLCLPSQAGDEWNYNVHIGGKYTERPENEEITVQVLKVWHDENPPTRPISATVALYGDGVLYDTVTLEQSNNWRHSWTGLSALTVWTVAEVDVPDGYIVSVGQDNGLYGVTNSTPEDDEGSTNPTEPSDPTEPSNPTEPSEPSEPSEPTSEPSTQPPLPDEPELPNTGLLWWPVPVMGVCGIVCLAFGIARRRGSDNEE